MTVFLLVVAQFVTGLGIITRLQAVTNGFSLLGLAMLAGLGISSGLPLLLQVVHLPVTVLSLFTSLGLLAFLPLFLLRGQLGYLKALFSRKKLAMRLYELPFLGFWGFLLFISAWKCAWFPNLPFDTLVGPDLVARFAVKEHTLASSVFTSHLPSVSVFSNQPFYAPFTAMQQVLYLLAAQGEGPFAFGKLWLTVLVVAFGLFLYAELRERIHPLLAGGLVTLLACSPELFAYTFLVQTDWANAAFFASGVMLLQRYLETDRLGALIASALFFALACWTRTETIFFVPIGSLLVLTRWVSASPTRAFIRATFLLLASLLPILFWNVIFLGNYLPLPPHTPLGTIHAVSPDYLPHLSGVFRGMITQVVFRPDCWNYAVEIFLALTLFNVVVFRDRYGVSVLVWLLGVFMLFGFLIQHIDGANIAYTFRRGFFKLLFLMYFYLGTTSLFRWLSGWLYHWEGQPRVAGQVRS